MTIRAEKDRLAREIVRVGNGGDPFAAAVRATRMPMVITDPHQPDNPIIFINDAFTRLTGYTREEIIGRNCRFLQGPQTDRSDVARIREAIADRRQIEIDLLNHKKDGEVFWNRLLIAPVFDDESGELRFFFASQFDVTLERDRLVRLQQDRDALETAVERRTLALSESEQRLRFVLQAGRMGSCTVDLNTGDTVASDICKAIFGRRPQDSLVYADLLAMIHPDDIERMQATLAASVAGHTEYAIEYRIVMPSSGEVRWVEVRGQPFYAADDTPLTMVCVSIDITERKRVEEHRAFLARELEHRVKNTLATIQSITRQTLRTATSLDDAQERLDARIRSLAVAHDVLTRESWNGATIAEVAQGALAPFTAAGLRRFQTAGPDVRLPPRVALALSMALHELATNATKYGALSNNAGHVRFDWNIIDGPKPGQLWLRWKEFDGPPVVPPTRQGFGSRLIARTLATEMGGTAEMEFHPQGLVFTAQAPLPDQLTPDSEAPAPVYDAR